MSLAKSNQDNFLYPVNNYYGKFTLQNLVFNANLQQFADQVMYLCNLETNGKISPEDAYNQIKDLWKQLKNSKQELLDHTNFNPE